MGKPETQPSPPHASYCPGGIFQRASPRQPQQDSKPPGRRLLGRGQGSIKDYLYLQSGSDPPCPQHCAAVLPVQPVNAHLFVTNVQQCKITCGRLVQPPQL